MLFYSFVVMMRTVTAARQLHQHWQHSSGILVTMALRTVLSLIDALILMPRIARFGSQKGQKR